MRQETKKLFTASKKDKDFLAQIYRDDGGVPIRQYSILMLKKYYLRVCIMGIF